MLPAIAPANGFLIGQDRNRVRSYLQNGQHLPTQSLRERETFEENLQKMDAARSSFLKEVMPLGFSTRSLRSGLK